MDMIGHDDGDSQINLPLVQLHATLQRNGTSRRWHSPTQEGRKCHVEGPVVLENVREGPPVEVFAIMLHTLRNNSFTGVSL